MSRCSVVSHQVLPSAIAPAPRPHASATRTTGSGPARAAIGSDSSTDAKKHAVNGWRGRRRTEASAPRIAPKAPVAETSPQSRAPLKCATNVGGPSTMNAARQKFEIAKPTIGARTHERETTSRKPSRSWRRKLAGSDSACAAIFSWKRKNALTTKLAESIANSQPVPTVATSAPETAGPKTLSRFRESEISAFAPWRFCGLTVCGTSPSAAGLKNADAAPKTAAVTKKSGSVMLCVRSIAAVNASTTARTPSHASMTVRRGRRSATTPPASVKATRASVKAARTAPSAVAEPSTERTAKASATGMSASPTADETRPSQSNLNGRSASSANVPPDPTAGKRSPYLPEVLCRFRVGNGSHDGRRSSVEAPASRRGGRGRAPVPKALGGGAPVCAARAPLPRRRGGRDAVGVHPRAAGARARREGAHAAELADQDRAQRVPAAPVVTEGNDRATGAACRGARGARPGRRSEARARGAARHTTAGARAARARRTLLRGDRSRAVPVGRGDRDADLPCAPLAVRAARRCDELRGVCRPASRRVRAPARPCARAGLRWVRDARASGARPQERAQAHRLGARPAVVGTEGRSGRSHDRDRRGCRDRRAAEGAAAPRARTGGAGAGG